MQVEKMSISNYPFSKNDFAHYFSTLYKDRGLKAIYQLFNRAHRRPYSRGLIKRFSPQGLGLEIGCGARTISPTNRTILSDAFSEHGVHHSIAQVFFKGDTIPFENDSFDFLLSEHVLEHITDPIRSLHECIRVLKPNGHLFVFLPHKERTNDRYRELTTLEHLIEDHQKKIPFNDQYHFEDWYQNVVLKGLLPAHYEKLNREELLNTASIHHHVWTEKEISALFEYLKLKVVYVDSKVFDRRDSFVVIGQKK